MAKIHAGATVTPHFREFPPRWVARQRWYRGTGVPELSPVGFFRFEDPAGEVGIETHLVTDGAELHQVPMTYRGEPTGAGPGSYQRFRRAERSNRLFGRSCRVC